MKLLRSIQIFCIFVLSWLSLHAGTSEPETLFKELSLSELEQLKEETKSELGQMAHISLNSGLGAVGFRSHSYSDGNHNEWVQVELQGTYQVDTIFIVPTLWRDTSIGFVNDAFPDRFSILIGSDEYPEGKVIFEYDANVERYKGIVPMRIPVSPTTVNWIRLEASNLTPRAIDGKYVFQISEIMVFSGEENVALRKPVSSSSRVYESIARNAATLVDGILPYLMNSASDEYSQPMSAPWVSVSNLPSPST